MPNQRCPQQSYVHGCRIVGQLQRPMFCSTWSCGWVAGWFRDGLRPDRAGYFVDPVPTDISFGDVGPGGEKWRSVQVWLDPKQPFAHRDPSLREWLIEQAKDRDLLAIARFGGDATVLVPPRHSRSGLWEELPTRQMPPAEVRKVRLEVHEERIRKAIKDGHRDADPSQPG